jgi:hypothetical protein
MLTKSNVFKWIHFNYLFLHKFKFNYKNNYINTHIFFYEFNFLTF